MTIVCISNTHNTQPTLPSGNILLHAGDVNNSVTFAELQSTLAWRRARPYPHKIFIAGTRTFSSTRPSPRRHHPPPERAKID